jgi:selenocysteine lyase/cysteine desulfurase
MVKALQVATSPGRSGHQLSLEAARIVYATRNAAAHTFGVADARRVIFTSGCTEALNLVLHSLPEDRPHVVTTALEHNSVARPLRWLADHRQFSYSTVAADDAGFIDPDKLAAACLPSTALVVVNHGSNVCGSIQDLTAIRKAIGNRLLLVDAAQTAGHVPLSLQADGIDYVAFSGHKGLGGPPGIGGLCIGQQAPIPHPLRQGGTGSRSEYDRHPDFLPDALEAGTPNLPGIAGLGAALKLLEAKGIAVRMEEELAVTKAFLEGVRNIRNIRLSGPTDSFRRLPVFSLVIAGQDPGRVARRLEQEYGLLVRSGLHCAPWAHRALKTIDTGSVRISFSAGSPPNAVSRTLAALEALCS